MTTPRANVEVAVVGDRLYAVGGFSGKTFLNTIEYLDENTNEWTTFVPKDNADLSLLRSRSRTSSRISFSEDSQLKDEIININAQSGVKEKKSVVINPEVTEIVENGGDHLKTNGKA